MNVKTDQLGFVKLAPARRRGGNTRSVHRVAGKIAQSAATWAKIFSAAREAAYLAERYYAMNDAELARLGLTRDHIRTVLLRVLTRY